MGAGGTAKPGHGEKVAGMQSASAKARAQLCTATFGGAHQNLQAHRLPGCWELRHGISESIFKGAAHI